MGSYTCSDDVIEIVNNKGASGTAVLSEGSNGLTRVLLEGDDWGKDYLFTVAGVD